MINKLITLGFDVNENGFNIMLNKVQTDGRLRNRLVHIKRKLMS